MNKSNPYWRCSQCRMRLHRQLSEPANDILAGIASQARVPTPKLVHVCGRCKAMHYETEDGKLRPLTPAERLDLEVHIPEAMAHVRDTDFGAAEDPTGSLIIARDE